MGYMEGIDWIRWDRQTDKLMGWMDERVEE